MSYDAVGQLTLASEYRGDNGAHVWSADYDFDRYNNRQQTSSGSTYNMSYVPVTSSEIVAATNRFVATGSTPMTYDAAGNITEDAKFRNQRYTYDAKGRQTSSENLDTTGHATAVYDGVGQRVATAVGSTVQHFVFDAAGNVVEEYGGSAGSGAVVYPFVDLQGSTRVTMNQSASITDRHDYYPFGEEIASGTGMRTSGQGFGGIDTTKPRYAGMERDAATSGLDQTWFRKYEDKSGRWTSPDPYQGSMHTSDPQSLNRYTYVGSDPVNTTDGTGLSHDSEQLIFPEDQSIGSSEETPSILKDAYTSFFENMPILMGTSIFAPSTNNGKTNTLKDAIAQAKTAFNNNQACQNLFAGTDAASLFTLMDQAAPDLTNTKALDANTGKDKDFSSELQAAQTVRDGLGPGRPSIRFNENGFFFNGTIATATGVENVIFWANTNKDTSTRAAALAGMSVDDIRALTVLHEMYHVYDTSGGYDDDTAANQGNAALLDKLIRNACFPSR